MVSVVIQVYILNNVYNYFIGRRTYDIRNNKRDIIEGRTNELIIIIFSSETLGVTVDQVESCVEGLTYLFTESSRAKIPELDFVDSLIILQFPKEVNELLKQVIYS
jgi:hypothetical protein